MKEDKLCPKASLLLRDRPSPRKQFSLPGATFLVPAKAVHYMSWKAADGQYYRCLLTAVTAFRLFDLKIVPIAALGNKII